MRKNVNVVHPVTGRSKRFAKIYVHDGNDIDADAIMAEAKIQFQWDAELSFSTEEFSAAEFDDEERDECVRRCVQYVSPSQGDCCGISSVDCGDYPISTSSSSSGKGSKNGN